MIKNLTDSDFHSVIDNEEVTLVKFGASWCGPCKVLAPIIEQIAEEVSFPVYEVDVDEAMDIAEEFKIRGVPTVIIFKRGKIHNKISGLTSKNNILKLFE